MNLPATPPAPARNLAWWAKHHFEKIRWTSFALWALPGLWLAWQLASGTLAPLEDTPARHEVLNFTGRWAFIMLLVTLTVTPARRFSAKFAQAWHARYGKRLSDWNWLIKLRRQLGLYSFFYAALHWLVYLVCDAGASLSQFLGHDLLARRPMLMGTLALVLLVPLALTSNQASIRALGRQWRRLHMLSYPIALLAMAHMWLQPVAGHSNPWPYTAAVAVLLGARLVSWWWGDRGPGMEVKERSGPGSRRSQPATAGSA